MPDALAVYTGHGNGETQTENRQMANIAQKLNPEQIENIVDKIVPLIAAPEDHEFFKGVLFCKLESCASSAEASAFIAKMLKAA